MIRRVVRAAARRLLRLRPRPAILMYHRVIATESDPWGLAVEPERFRQHVEHLARRRSVLPMPDFVEALTTGKLPADAVAITFDDGYVDNMRNAEPILAAAGLPATLFVVSGMVGRTEPFWWDELAALILDRHEPMDCQVPLGNALHRISIPDREATDDHNGWRTWQPPRSARQQAYVKVWRELRELSPTARACAMESLRAGAPAIPGRSDDRALTSEELRAIASRGTFTIGAHTVTHPVLPELDFDRRRDEIREGKGELERLLGGQVTGFAYPFGEADEATRDAAAKAGFDWACAIRAIGGRPPSDRFGLPRISAPDRGAASLAAAMSAGPDMRRTVV